MLIARASERTLEHLKTPQRALDVSTAPMTANDHRLIPVTQWNDYHVWPPIGGLRRLISRSSNNGFDKVIKRVGGRVLIDETEFFEWVERMTDLKSKTGDRK